MGRLWQCLPSILTRRADTVSSLAVRKNHFVYLLAALLIFLVVAPLLRAFALHPVVPVIYSAALVTGVWSLLGVRRWFKLGMALVIAGLAAAAISTLFELPFSHFALELIYLVFLILIGLVSLRQVLFAETIDANRLIGAVCVYLIFGIIFALLYYWLAALRPGAFSGVNGGAAANPWDFLYYSFVTLTTLGYGDITPQLPLARTMAYLEAVAGQFYVAILVAMLVGGYLADKQSARSAPFPQFRD